MFEDNKIKKSIVITLALLSLFLLAKFVAEVKGFRFIGSYPSGQSVISVSGKGEVVGIPDVATFSFGVTEESLIVSEVQNEAAKNINAIVAYLKANGVAEKDITTSGYNIYPRYETDTKVMTSGMYPYPTGKQRLAAYVVTESITVKVRKLADAGKLLAGIGEQGATDISGLSFDFDKRDELAKEARDKAITEARREADKLAKSLGVDLVRIISYNDNGNYYPMYAKTMMAEAYGRGGDATVAPAIPVGEDKIISNVTITYEVK
ncbi:MAG: SIMPL domain-containing protein [bacterium]|nr:SIMPL domain-containing protein [bacterium]